MKLDCELIQDLLPMYEEGLCSPASRQAVEAHLQECAHCRALTAPLAIERPEEPPAADRAVKKSIKKVRRRWLASLLAAVLIVPLLLLGFNQYRGAGLCFTNADDIVTAWRFLRALETEDWEAAAGMHDFAVNYEHIREALGLDVSAWDADTQLAQELYSLTHEDIGWVAELTEEEFIQEMTRRYTDDLRAMGDTVIFDCTGYRGISVYGYTDDQTSWRVTFAVTVTQNGRSEDAELQIAVTDGRIGAAGIYKPGTEWLDAIDRALYPSAHAGY